MLYIGKFVVLGITGDSLHKGLHVVSVKAQPDGHQGIDMMQRRARQTVFWPGISVYITSTVQASDLARLPAQSAEGTLAK